MSACKRRCHTAIYVSSYCYICVIIQVWGVLGKVELLLAGLQSADQVIRSDSDESGPALLTCFTS